MTRPDVVNLGKADGLFDIVGAARRFAELQQENRDEL